MPHLKQRALISRQIRKEVTFKRQALKKRRAGRMLTAQERRAIKRPRKQLVAIGFSKARAIDPSIPMQMGRVR